MLLCLMRHGIAVELPARSRMADRDRTLTEEGVRRTREVACGLAALELSFAAFLTSPYPRAAQTAEIVAAALGFPKDKIRRTEALAPGATPADFFKLLAELRPQGAIGFGHAPGMDDLIACAVNSGRSLTQLKKAGVACLEMASLAPPRGELLALYPPKTLRLIKNRKGT